MGGGPATRKVVRTEVGIVPESGIPIVNCPTEGALAAHATEESKDGEGGRLEVRQSRLELVDETGATVAVAVASEEATRVSACILDGLDYTAVLRRTSTSSRKSSWEKSNPPASMMPTRTLWPPRCRSESAMGGGAHRSGGFDVSVRW